MDRIKQASQVARNLGNAKSPVDLYDTSRLHSLLEMVQQSQQQDDQADLAAASEYASEAFQPAREDAPDQYIAEESSPEAIDQHHSGCILVVEDEREVREMAEAALEMQGYSVFTVANGKEALAYYLRHVNQIDLVLSDVVMPEMNGQDLLSEILRINPHARTVMMSGYCTDATAADLISRGAAAFLLKPYSLEDLWSTIETVLQGTTAAR